ncbi:MAG: hypothetical protein DHS20C07_07620 [Methyloligella sp.]|nr:MAG: hypothetical protein DHS20C07_07620 [Methyloligella sp.]
MTKQTEDFPAAHSMDTSWFGVDENGEIAIFETGENGCLPTSATFSAEEPNWNDFFQLFPTDEDGFYLIPLDGTELANLCTLENFKETFKAVEQRKVFTDYFILLLASDSSAKLFSPKTKEAQDEWEYEKPFKLEGDPPLLFVPYSDLSIQKIEQGIQNNDILGIAPLKRNPSRIEKAADAQGLSVENYLKSFSKHSLSYVKQELKKENIEWFREFLGLHFYGPDDETGFYEADMRPNNPLKISDLSEEHKKKLDPLQFKNIKFAETAALQPAALVDVDQWGMGKAWIDIHGKYHETLKFNKSGQLLKEDKTPYTEEEMKNLAIRPLGKQPINPDTIEWPEVDEEISYQQPPLRENFITKLLKRFF